MNSNSKEYYKTPPSLSGRDGVGLNLYAQKTHDPRSTSAQFLHNPCTIHAQSKQLNQLIINKTMHNFVHQKIRAQCTKIFFQEL